MKKITLTIAAIALFINASTAQDAAKFPKAFKQGDFTVSLGAGLGVYGTKIHSEYQYNAVVWTGSGFATETRTFKSDTTDGAFSAIYPITFEYGVTSWLGIGVRAAYSNYFEETDSISGIKGKVRSYDADLVVNFHLVKSKHFDMPISLTLGYSNIKFWQNDAVNSIAKDNGLNYGIALVPRIYFGNHIGMFFNVGYAGYSYPSFDFSNDNDPNINNTQHWKYSLKGNGINLGMGLIGKF